MLKIYIVFFMFAYLLKYTPAFAGEKSSNFSALEFFQSLETMSLQEREQSILDVIKEGHIPNFLHQLVPVQVDLKDQGLDLQAVFFVMPDYLSIGDDDDFIRVPMTPVLAQKLADMLDFMLPTPKMVDAIYKQASEKLSPRPLPYGQDMVKPSKFIEHNEKIQQQLSDDSVGQLIAGHKKDIVISKKLGEQSDRVAIYGWHRKNGKPIQSLSLVHDHEYADYSHGVRLISKVMLVNGQSKLLSEVLKNENLANLISYEGHLPEELHRFASR